MIFLALLRKIMYPKPIQKLIEYFSKLPGVGPRAAGRYVFSLMKESPEFVKEFGIALANLPSSVSSCEECFRSIEKANSNGALCAFCGNPSRVKNSIMVLEKESDLLAIEKTGTFQGLYHVLGGTLSPLEQDSAKKLRIKELYNRIAERKKTIPDMEIILATNPTPEGDMTANYIQRVLEPLQVSITRLGRGITAGSELEYLDDSTVMHALKNRK